MDDSSVVRRILNQLFTGNGEFHVCGEAENGREAVERAQQLRPDLIVTDLSMPVMNGLEATPSEAAHARRADHYLYEPQ